MKRLRLFLLNGCILLFTSLLINIIGMFFNVYISNRIGTEAVGTFSLIMSVYLFAITIATSGINLATTRIISEAIAKNSPVTELKKASLTCIKFGLILGIAAFCIFFASANYICANWLHGKVDPITIYFIASALPFISMSSAINGYFCANRKVIKSASAQILENFIKIFATGSLLTIFLPKGLEYACLALIIGDFISEVFSFLYIFLLYKLDVRKLNLYRSNSNSYTKQILKICTPVAITSYIKSALSTLKQMLIPSKLESSGLSCSEALSKYGIINGMTMPIFMFPSLILNSFSGLLVPEVSHFYVKNNIDKINKMISVIFKLTILFSICTTGIFITFSDSISFAIYNNYTVANYLKALSPLVLFIYLDSIIDSILKGLNKQVSIMLCNICDLFISISFILLLLPIKGVTGYIIIIYISELFNFSVSITQLYKVTHFKFDFKNWILKPLVAVFISCFLLKKLVQTAFLSVPTLVLDIMIFVLIYIVILIFSDLTKFFITTNIN